MRRRTTLTTLTALLAAASLAVAGCGSSSDASAPAADEATTAAETVETTSTVSETPDATAAEVAVTLGKPQEFSLSADPADVAAGQVTFNVDNQGALLHEMVVVPAEGGAASLKQANGEASEDGAAGEVADLAAGKTGSITVTLPAGKYVLLCNLPGHFAGGMYTDFTVN